MKLGIIGCGKLGTALVASFLSSGALRPPNVLVVERDESHRTELAKRFGVKVLGAPSAELRGLDVLLFAVRPQDFDKAAEGIKEFVKDQVIISVMAGITIEKISQALSSPTYTVTQIIRGLPNLPVKIRKGITPYVIHEGVSNHSAELAHKILASTGDALILKEESLIDAATAISGSGPGYLYYIFAEMIETAMELGFTREQAESLVGETAVGASELWFNGDIAIEELREEVRSKGGTTDAAFAVFDKHGLGKIIREGLKAAHFRAAELGRGKLH